MKVFKAKGKELRSTHWLAKIVATIFQLSGIVATLAGIGFLVVYFIISNNGAGTALPNPLQNGIILLVLGIVTIILVLNLNVRTVMYSVQLLDDEIIVIKNEEPFKLPLNELTLIEYIGHKPKISILSNIDESVLVFIDTSNGLYQELKNLVKTESVTIIGFDRNRGSSFIKLENGDKITYGYGNGESFSNFHYTFKAKGEKMIFKGKEAKVLIPPLKFEV